MITVCGAGVSQTTTTIMCAGAAERALGWESADLSSRPGFVTTELSDLGQVTSSLGASFLFSKIQWGGGRDLKLISLRHKTTSLSIEVLTGKDPVIRIIYGIPLNQLFT